MRFGGDLSRISVVWGFFSLLVGFGDWCQAAGDAFAVGFELLFVAER